MSIARLDLHLECGEDGGQVAIDESEGGFD